jgi:hypothetical protein
VRLPPGRLELLHELVPAATIIAILVNPTNPIAETVSRDMQAAARARGLQVHLLHASTERELDAVFATLVQLRAGGLVVGSGDPFFNSRSKQLGELSDSIRLLRARGERPRRRAADKRDEIAAFHVNVPGQSKGTTIKAAMSGHP